MMSVKVNSSNNHSNETKVNRISVLIQWTVQQQQPIQQPLGIFYWKKKINHFFFQTIVFWRHPRNKRIDPSPAAHQSSKTIPRPAVDQIWNSKCTFRKIFIFFGSSFKRLVRVNKRRTWTTQPQNDACCYLQTSALQYLLERSIPSPHDC